MSDINPQELRRAFGTYMTGVTVVTAKSADGENIGFTANSFSSVSLDPPLLSICLAKSLSSLAVFEECSHFAVNILAEAQEDISNLFASYQGDRFAKVDWTTDKNNCPIIEGVTTHFSCRNYQLVDAGDHVILLGEITEFDTTGHEGLGYSNQGYYSLGLERGAVEPPKSMRSFKVGVIIESDGKVLLQESDKGLELPSVDVEKRTGALAVISKHIKENNIEVEFGPVYSIFDNEKSGEYSVYFLANSVSKEKTALGDFYPIESLASLPLAPGSLTTMLKRYSLETKAGVFGLYLGDEDTGDVHTL